MQSTSPSKTTSRKSSPLLDWKSRQYRYAEDYCREAYQRVFSSSNATADPITFVLASSTISAEERTKFFADLAEKLGSTRGELVMQLANQLYRGHPAATNRFFEVIDAQSREFIAKQKDVLTTADRTKQLADLQGEFIKTISGLNTADDSLFTQFKKDVDRLSRFN